MGRPLGPTFYDILGVRSSDSQREIRKAYLALMKAYHPDVGSEREAAGNPQRSQLINEAFNTLKDPARRARYDADLRYWRRGVGAEPWPGRALAKWRAGPLRHHGSLRSVCPGDTNRLNRRASIKASVGLLIFVAAASAIAVYLREPIGPSDVSPLDPPEARPDLLAGQPEVLPAVIADSIGDYIWIRANGSADGAMRYSRDCFEQLREFRNLRLVDRCVAFDLAWQSDLAQHPDAHPAVVRQFFSPRTSGERHRASLRELSADDRANDARLDVIGQYATSELALITRPTSSDADPGQEGPIKADHPRR